MQELATIDNTRSRPRPRPRYSIDLGASTDPLGHLRAWIVNYTPSSGNDSVMDLAVAGIGSYLAPSLFGVSMLEMLCTRDAERCIRTICSTRLFSPMDIRVLATMFSKRAMWCHYTQYMLGIDDDEFESMIWSDVSHHSISPHENNDSVVLRWRQRVEERISSCIPQLIKPLVKIIMRYIFQDQTRIIWMHISQTHNSRYFSGRHAGLLLV